MPRYQTKTIQLSSGQVLTLPGSEIFEQVAAIPREIDIYNIDTVQRFPLGTMIEMQDWALRYIEYGGTTKSADVLQAEAPDAAHDDLTAGVDGSVGGVAASFVAGSKVINISDTITLVLNEYAGGLMTMEDVTGEGYAYLIESHDAPASDALFIIKHGLAVAIAADTTISLTKSKYKEVIIQPVTHTAITVGVGVAVGADGSFGWMYTAGIVPVRTEGGITIGHAVRVSETTAGAVALLDFDEADDANLGQLGNCVNVGATTETSVIELTGVSR